MQTWLLYLTSIGLLALSWQKDKKKTKMALKKAMKSFDNILPQILGVITLVGVMLAILNPDVISRLIGGDSGWLGVVAASLVGGITLIPGFIAFPTAAMLLERGAGYMQIAAFISSLMMVGVMTFSIESKYFSKKAAFIRNVSAFIFSFLVAVVIGKVMGEF